METLSTAMNFRLRKFNFEHAFRPLYYFSRFTGQWPFSIIHNPNGTIRKARICFFDILCAILMICLNLKLSFDKYDKLRGGHVKNIPTIRFVVFCVFHKSSFLFTAIGIIIDVINHNKFIDVLRKFNTFDSEVLKVGIHFNHNRECRRVWLYFMTSLLILLFYLIFHTVEVFFSPKDFLLTFYRYCFNSFHFLIWIPVVISFIVFLRNLYERFAALNTLLRNRFLDGNTFKVSANIYRKDSIAIIKFIGRQHTFLTDIVDQLNVCYAFQVMINTAATFGTTVMTLHVYCNFILYSQQGMSILPWVYSFWLVPHLTGTLLIIYHCNLLTKEGRRTLRIVHDIINCSNDSELMKTLYHLSHQTVHRHPVVTCGLFTFDWTLVFNMIAATATYLTVVLNFERIQERN